MLYSSSGCQYYRTGHGILQQRPNIISEKQIRRNMSHSSSATRLMWFCTLGRECYHYFTRPYLIEYARCVIFLGTHSCVGSSGRWYTYITIETVQSSEFTIFSRNFLEIFSISTNVAQEEIIWNWDDGALRPNGLRGRNERRQFYETWAVIFQHSSPFLDCGKPDNYVSPCSTSLFIMGKDISNDSRFVSWSLIRNIRFQIVINR